MGKIEDGNIRKWKGIKIINWALKWLIKSLVRLIIITDTINKWTVRWV